MESDPSLAHCTPLCSAALQNTSPPQAAGPGQRVVESPSQTWPSCSATGLRCPRAASARQRQAAGGWLLVRSAGCEQHDRRRRRCRRRQPPRIATDRDCGPILPEPASCTHAACSAAATSGGGAGAGGRLAAAHAAAAGRRGTHCGAGGGRPRPQGPQGGAGAGIPRHPFLAGGARGGVWVLQGVCPRGLCRLESGSRCTATLHRHRALEQALLDCCQPACLRSAPSRRRHPAAAPWLTGKRASCSQRVSARRWPHLQAAAVSKLVMVVTRLATARR